MNHKTNNKGDSKKQNKETSKRAMNENAKNQRMRTQLTNGRLALNGQLGPGPLVQQPRTQGSCLCWLSVVSTGDSKKNKKHCKKTMKETAKRSMNENAKNNKRERNSLLWTAGIKWPPGPRGLWPMGPNTQGKWRCWLSIVKNSTWDSNKSNKWDSKKNNVRQQKKETANCTMKET